MKPLTTVVTAAAAAMIGLVGFGIKPSAATGALESAAMVIEPENCTYYCRTCNGRDDYHDIVTATTSNAKSAHLENCNKGECSSHACGSALAAAEIRKAWNDFVEARGDRLESLLEKYVHIVSYNEQRNAIQFICEKGMVIASMPAQAEQVPTLLAHTRSVASELSPTNAE
jgi:hypothetical protein